MRKKRFGKRERIVYGKLDEVIEVPNLLSVQLESYRRFLEKGIMDVLKKFSPIESQPHKADLRRNEKGFSLEFVSTRIGEPKDTEEDCKEKGLTYNVPVYVLVRITDINTGEIKEEEAFLGHIPKMTDRATFIINGAERVVVNQLVRSPGIYFVEEPRASFSMKPIYIAHFLPVRGAWLELIHNLNRDVLQARIDRRRKVNLILFLKAIGFDDNMELFKFFPRKIEIIDEDDLYEHENSIVIEDVKANTGRVILSAGEKLNRKVFEDIISSDVREIKILDPYIQKTFETLNDEAQNYSSDEACLELFRKLRPGEIPRINAARAYIMGLYFNSEKFDLSEVGRHKLNKRLQVAYERYLEEIGEEIKEYQPDELVLTPMDIILATRHLLQLETHPEFLDTKDHLGNKRVRTVGELIQLEFERAFSRIQKIIQEKLTLYSSLDKISVQSLINVRPMIAIMNQFFAGSQLSQFMDQINPLAELTHKRRLSAIGPGGLKKEHARFEVRDVHHSHYGRMCPIETPEGANIGLITSMATYTTVDKYGFLMTPYRKVINGKVTNKVVYLTADEEEQYNITQASTPIDEEGNLVEELVPVRYMETIKYVPREEVDFMDISPKQIVSVSTSLIPFLEHDDANRALMGSNMQRQAVPLVKPEAPLVGTGMEAIAARDSGYVILARHNGIVKKVDSRKILIERTDENQKPLKDKNGNPIIDEYTLLKFVRSNQDTCINQRPIVNAGDFVRKGEPIADGPATDMGELALGRNILVAFMPWEGYNFEDAILVSEKLLEEDAFTSIHIEVYETHVRETRLGPEEVTAEIPNVNKELLRNLDENGIVRIGAFVSSKDVLVGKVTPKGEEDITPEEKIIRSVFGEKGRDVQDTSLRLPHGVQGRVIDVKIFDREEVSELGAGVNKLIKVYVASRKSLDIGDKLAGRHGNKGVVSKILAKEDMPFLPDGTPVDMVLSPLGVPSRMNIGQILETHLGWLAKLTNTYVATPVFAGASEDEIMEELYKVRKQFGIDQGDSEEEKTGKVILRDGRTGLPFEQPVVVGYMYMMKLIHIAQDKIHARSTGPYSLIHQQPLGGKAQFGGQRFGEMEVWALEAYGAAHTLSEMLNVKSDDVKGRNEVYKAILKDKNIPEPGIPESFKVLIKELQGLALDVRVYDEEGNELNLDSL